MKGLVKDSSMFKHTNVRNCIQAGKDKHEVLSEIALAADNDWSPATHLAMCHTVNCVGKPKQ